MKALVLCAGLGTRLRPLTLTWPKPAVPLLGPPLFRYTLAALRRGGVESIGINTHHLPAVMEATARAEAARAGLSVEVSHEPVIQGTAGGIRGQKALVKDAAFVVWNGDILFAVDLARATAEHAASGADATMVLMAMPVGETYAAVEVDPGGRVVRIAGRGPGAPGATPWHFTGVHVLSPSVFSFMSPSGEEDINRDVYPRMMAQGRVVRGWVQDAYWSDLGTSARYLATQAALLRGRVPTDAFPGVAPPTVFEERASVPALLDPSCTVEPGVEIGADVFVGERARVASGARLENCAVLDHTVIQAGEQLTGVIAWGAHRLKAGAS